MEKLKCEKCGYVSRKNKRKNEKVLCEVCFSFSPENKEEFEKYLEEKIDWKKLDFFRKRIFELGERKKRGMFQKVNQGKVVSRAPFGYKIINKVLVPSESFREVEEIFEEFLRENISLRKLAKKHNFSVNGLKKVLTNFTYLGKIKFSHGIYQGNHKPIVSSTLFNHVQDKLERLKIKLKN